MHFFSWVSPGDILPGYDLRARGWLLAKGLATHADGVSLADCRGLDRLGWFRFLTVHPRPFRRRMVLLGIPPGDDRARLLSLGFGDVVGASVTLAEIEARAQRVLDSTRLVPRWRDLGLLRLDLVARDAIVGARAVGLHPREFGLLWRLADTPGLAVTKADLMRDVWRMSHVPETNSLAVHVSRLRAKLDLAGFGGLIQTTSDGAYRLVAAAGVPLAAGSPERDRYLVTNGVPSTASTLPAGCRHDN